MKAIEFAIKYCFNHYDIKTVEKMFGSSSVGEDKTEEEWHEILKKDFVYNSDALEKKIRGRELLTKKKTSDSKESE